MKIENNKPTELLTTKEVLSRYNISSASWTSAKKKFKFKKYVFGWTMYSSSEIEKAFLTPRK